MKRLLITAAVSALLLTGCATDAESPTAAAPGPDRSAAAPAASVPAGAEQLLAKYELAGRPTTEIIDHLDRLGGDDRPADLRASVRPDELLVSGGGAEYSLDIPQDRFYLSVAPYVNQTHECFYHSLTTCKGELAGKDVQVRIVDRTNDRVLVDEVRTTFANGFVGFWLPRDIEGTLRVSYDGKAAETEISTDPAAPTCLTTVKLA